MCLPASGHAQLPLRGVGTTVPHTQGSLCGFTCHSPVVWSERSFGGDECPRVQGWEGMREGFSLLRGGQSPWGGQGQWMPKLGPAQALLVTGRSGGRCRADQIPAQVSPQSLHTTLRTGASVRSGCWPPRPEGLETSPVCVSLAPDTDAQPLLSAAPPRQVTSDLCLRCLPSPSPGRLTPLAPRPSFPCPLLAPSPQPPWQPGPAQARLFWKNAGRWQNVRSSSSLQTGAPIPGQTAAVFAVHKGLCSPSRPGDPGQAVGEERGGKGRGEGGGSRRTSPACSPWERDTDRPGDDSLPSAGWPSHLAAGGQTEGSRRTRFLSLCCHTGHATGGGIHMPRTDRPGGSSGVSRCLRGP